MPHPLLLLPGGPLPSWRRWAPDLDVLSVLSYFLLFKAQVRWVFLVGLAGSPWEPPAAGGGLFHGQGVAQRGWDLVRGKTGRWSPLCRGQKLLQRLLDALVTCFLLPPPAGRPRACSGWGPQLPCGPPSDRWDGTFLFCGSSLMGLSTYFLSSLPFVSLPLRLLTTVPGCCVQVHVVTAEKGLFLTRSFNCSRHTEPLP